jgi:hypothetical protein
MSDAAVGAADSAELNEGHGREEEEDCGHRGLEKIEEGDPGDEEEENPKGIPSPRRKRAWANRSRTQVTVACGLRPVDRIRTVIYMNDPTTALIFRIATEVSSRRVQGWFRPTI